MQNGVFITIEGPDGSGKSSILKAAAARLAVEGISVTQTREPGGIDIAEQIRQVILDPKNTAMDARTEALLYAASRRQHLAEKVIPALERGEIVLCDRFVDSSMAYQGSGRGLGIDQIFQINQFAIQKMMPKLTVLLMVKPEVGLERIAQNRDKSMVDRLDREDLAFHQRVYEGYQILVQRFPDRIKVVDASQDFDVVLEEATAMIKKFLQNQQ